MERPPGWQPAQPSTSATVRQQRRQGVHYGTAPLATQTGNVRLAALVLPAKGRVTTGLAQQPAVYGNQPVLGNPPSVVTPVVVQPVRPTDLQGHVPTDEELEAMAKKGITLPPNVVGTGHYVISTQRQDTADLLAYAPTYYMTEFIFDYENNIFATGERAPSWETSERHPYIAKKAGANLSTLVGGMLKPFDDQIFTNEASGHYGENWTPAIREQFLAHMAQYFTRVAQKPVTHSAGYKFNGAFKL